MRMRDHYSYSLFFYFLAYVPFTSTLFLINADNYQERVYWDIWSYLVPFALLVPSLLTALLFKRSYPSETLKLKILSSYISLTPLLALTPWVGNADGVGVIALGYLLLYSGLFTVVCSSYKKYTVFINMTAAVFFMLGLTLRFGSWAWLSFAVGTGGVSYGILKELFDENAITLERKTTRLPPIVFLSTVIYHALLLVFFAGKKSLPFILIDVILVLVILKLAGEIPHPEPMD
jgi:hypothetical protein